jgi:hypothetical protein
MEYGIDQTLRVEGCEVRLFARCSCRLRLSELGHGFIASCALV